MAKLDALAGLAADEQLGVFLEQAVELLVGGNYLTIENPPLGLIDDVVKGDSSRLFDFSRR